MNTEQRTQRVWYIHRKEDKSKGLGVRNENNIFKVLPNQHIQLHNHKFCLCGSRTHMKTNHNDCPLNERYDDAN